MKSLSLIRAIRTQHKSVSLLVDKTNRSVFIHYSPFFRSATNRQNSSSSSRTRYFSTNEYDFKQLDSSLWPTTVESPGPTGDLFHATLRGDPSSSTSLVHKTASIRRTFTQQCNAQVMLISGGRVLAAHASFDPEYKRARSYIFNHPVGSAVLSPVLISGLIGALVEAALPQSVFQSNSLKQVQPLIVGVRFCERRRNKSSIFITMYFDNSHRLFFLLLWGSVNGFHHPLNSFKLKVEVEATIEVSHVSDHLSLNRDEKTQGYDIELKTEVRRFRDREIIATGTHSVWFPNYDMI